MREHIDRGTGRESEGELLTINRGDNARRTVPLSETKVGDLLEMPQDFGDAVFLRVWAPPDTEAILLARLDSGLMYFYHSDSSAPVVLLDGELTVRDRP